MRTAPALLAAATLAAVLVAPATAMAQWEEREPFPVPPFTLSGAFGMSEKSPVGEDLATIIGNNNGWTATLSDLSYIQWAFFDTVVTDDGSSFDYVVSFYDTWYNVGTFDFTFTGPDADLLNEIVASQFAHADLYFLNIDGSVAWLLELFGADDTSSIHFSIYGVYAATSQTFQTLQPDATYYVTTSLVDRRAGMFGRLSSGPDAVYTTGGKWPAISIADVSKAEGNKGSTAFVFGVTLSAPTADPISISYATRNGTASAPSDYKAASGTLMFNPGETWKTITVLVSGDRKTEADETFFVNLGSPPPRSAVADGSAVGTILNDDH